MIVGKVTEFGIYSAKGKQTSFDAPETAAGHSTIGDFEIIKMTDQIPMTKGLAFGFKWAAYGFPNSHEIKLLHVLEHPLLTTPDGKVSNSSNETHFYKPINGKIENTEGYMFTEDFELVEGQNKFSIIYDGKEIVSKALQVSKLPKP